MRLSSLSFAVALLCSSIALAQHHEAGSAPSPAPSPAPAPPSPSPSFSTASSAPVSHGSMSSAPASVPENHVAPSSGATFGPVSHSAPSETHSGPTTAPAAHVPEPSSGRVIPDQKISGENRIVSAPRIGEHPLEKQEEEKPAQSDLRHRICEGAACKERETKAEPPQSDLRRRVCLTGSCSCPAGQTQGKNGCVATAAAVPPDQCAGGQYWNGGSCLPSGQCRPEQTWNGANCVNSAAQCASFTTRGAGLVNELMGLKAQIREACSQSPTSSDCGDLKLRHRGTLQQYQMLRTEAGPNCWSTMADPASLE